MISISAFIISLFGIISLLYFRLWESRRGYRLFNDERKKLDDKVLSVGIYIKDNIPEFDRTIINRIYHSIVHYFAIIVLNIIKIIEHWMISLLEHVRGKREIKRGVTQSDFLRKVGDHKQSLGNQSKDAVE